MLEELNDLYQEVILDHSRRPRNFGPLENPTHSARGQNPLCGDDYSVFLIVQDGVIQEIRFEGSGCAISKASASLMTEALKGKTIEEARKLFDYMHQLIVRGETKEEIPGTDKLQVLAGVHRFPSRVKCAMLPWHTVLAALEGRAEATLR